MPSLPVAEDILWLSNTVGLAAVACRLAGTGLHRVYRGFFVYLLFCTLRSCVLRLFNPSQMAYGWVWLCTGPPMWALFGYAAFELSSIALRDFRGLASLSRKTLLAGLTICLVASVATLVVDSTQSRGDFPVLLAFNLARRAIYSTLTLYLLLLAGFLLWFPVPVTRNLLLHTVLLFFYSLTATALLFVRNLLGPSVIPQVSAALLAGNTVCLAGWLGLTRSGERRPAGMRLHWRPETERHLLDQLSALNTSLARSAAHRPPESTRRGPV
ncbi:MAG: hypothetical protein NT090_00735 [Acidobacteria bacterium]|nr:hypothetical protein [Acidobacteriota bacterium]